MSSLLQDLRVAIRQLRRSPGFALTTILTLALGIGATTAIFSLINAVLLRPLPFPDPDRVMWAMALDSSAGKPGLPSSLSYPDFFDWRARNHSFEAIASYRRNGHILTGSGTPQQLEGQTVSADLLRVLGVRPILGRGFVAEDEKPGTHVALLSHELWQSTFGGASDIVGRPITLDNISYTLIGVMPKGFQFPVQNPAPQVWTTLTDDAINTKDPMTAQRGADMLTLVGRLKPGVTIQQATADLSLIAQNLSTQYPDTNKQTTGATVVPELENVVGSTRSALNILFAAVVFVLLIACANVAGLMLTRASRRRPEMAVRAALGASRFEIMRQVLVESVVLSLCGGALGIALSVVLLKTMVRFVPQNLPRLDQVSVDSAVLAFAAVAIGKRIKPGLSDDVTPEGFREIVGVVGDVKFRRITAAMPAQYYLPFKQAIVLSPPVIIRTAADPLTVVGPLRDQLAQLDENIPLYRISTLEDYISLSAAQPRFQTVLLTFFAVIALLLSAVGLYAVLSYMVAQRTLEIGLRLALGAQRDNVLGLILRRGLILAATGLAIGTVVALLLTQFMAGMLYGVRPFDPVTFVSVSTVLLLVSLVASSVPAYRAARLDPMQTLRQQ